jgi:hypothetical protein
MGKKEWYFFYQKDHMYSTGWRVNQAIEASYSKTTGSYKEVYKPWNGWCCSLA